MYTRCSRDVQEVLGLSYARLVYVLCPGGCFLLFSMAFIAEYSKALHKGELA